ncbi:multiple epidermal growth factor-like domains protein 11 isoform X1 [Crassostrea angulata]|uniref:multiple epidermal growth factor-like domains protein 11 isoform X1 n=1 Tax=Magallana angulata TaxID=2784310 RepID=UPI0022B1E10E|nr:multiple epidermal growth factor-like domains protein 11 isoform X1 [Crassostrea angulata]
MLKMAAQKGVYVLLSIGRVLLFVGLSRQTPVSVQDLTTGIHCKTWDALLSICKECHNGYFGFNCTLQCRYPSFGSACQDKCNCNKTFCNPLRGCEDGSPTLPPKSTSTVIEKISVTPIITLKTTAACSVGFFGSSCDIPCRYPSFGFHFQSECICSEENCNHIVGCNETSTLCKSEEGHKSPALMYITVVLSVWAILQISIYLYLVLHSSSAIYFYISYS